MNKFKSLNEDEFDLMANLDRLAKEIDMNICELEMNFNKICQQSACNKKLCFESIYNFYCQYGSCKLKEFFVLDLIEEINGRF